MYTFDFATEVFHGDRFADIADVAMHAPPTPEQAERLRQGSALVFCKTDHVPDLFEILHPQAVISPAAKYVLISHNADRAVDASTFCGRPANVVRWYALNADHADADLVPIPSGMERPRGGGYSAHPEVIAQVLRRPRRFRNLVYMNHNDGTNHAERAPVTAL